MIIRKMKEWDLFHGRVGISYYNYKSGKLQIQNVANLRSYVS